eukprot:TRINITY_DN61788_c0_g1_i1.p1 TRINITY_DN61788_c0_g1~~TRINITY_DN61788_c0_g1_i1.p1  ORF type:complete len:498 (-),score=81.57 TRINITY_DN61788_c0_g1_i1:75-1568(-)
MSLRHLGLRIISAPRACLLASRHNLASLPLLRIAAVAESTRPSGRTAFSTNSSDKRDLVKQIKAWQREGDAYRECWHKYCRTIGSAFDDPARHEIAQLQQFLDDIKSGAIAPDTRVDGEKQLLVERVKAYKRQGVLFREQWDSFVQSTGSTNFDPSRHDGSVLEKFLSMEPSQTSEEQSINNRINDLARKDKWLEAKERFQSIQVKDVTLFNTILSAAIHCKQYQDGLQLIGETQASGATLTGVSYSCMLTILGHLGEVEKATELWEDMQRMRITQTPSCLTGLLRAYANRSDLGGLETCMKQAESQGWIISPVHFSVLIEACQAAGDTERVLRVIRDMSSRGMQVKPALYSHAMATCARASELGGTDEDQIDQAIADLKLQMLGDGIQFDERIMTWEIRTLLGGGPDCFDQSSVPAKRGQKAIAALEEARQKGIRLTSKLQRIEETLRRNTARSSNVPESTPTRWRQSFDESSGKPYYWNERDPRGTVTWQKPKSL